MSEIQARKMREDLIALGMSEEKVDAIMVEVGREESAKPVPAGFEIVDQVVALPESGHSVADPFFSVREGSFDCFSHRYEKRLYILRLGTDIVECGHVCLPQQFLCWTVFLSPVISDSTSSSER